jgi:hypothetical protein
MNASPSSVENFLHEQEGSSTDAGSLKTLSNVDLGVFRIDSQEDVGDEDNDVDTLPSTNKKDQNCDEKDGDINLIHDNHCHDNLPLYKATTTIDYAEATIVAPVDLSEGSLLRVDIGRHRILVAEVPTGGVHAGDVFTAPYRTWHSPLTTLELYREKAYNAGRYHGWIADTGPSYSTTVEAFVCPCGEYL